MLRRKRSVVVLLLGVLAAVPGVVAGAWLYDESTIDYRRGSATIEFLPKEEPAERPRPRRAVVRLPWPTYGLDPQRTHAAPDLSLRPPYRLRWVFSARHVIEFPPAVAYGRLYLAQQRGRFYAVHHRTGKIVWQRRFRYCSAATPTVAYRVVYHAWMQPFPCNRYPREQRGLLVAMAARTGRIIWRFHAAPFEGSPLVIAKTLYVGSWDRHLYAINIYTGKRRWRFRADHEVNTAPAYSAGTVYFGTDGGSVYAVDARTGRERWRAQALSRFGRREYFYASPTIAYGRVFMGNTDGTLYAFGARSGRLLWAQRAGTYIYSAAAVWRRRVYVGTYDGYFHAFDAATGDRIWRVPTAAAVHGAPTVMGGLVYFATCPRCGRRASRYAKLGDRGTYALDARTGKLVWHFPDGIFSPVVADSSHLYVVGRSRIFSFAPKTRRSRSRRRSQQGRGQGDQRAGANEKAPVSGGFPWSG